MKFALVNDVRTEPFPKLVGACPHCGGQVIAKCGQIKIHHWAHKGGLKRDCKWEQETQWHRDWKNKFPDDWQEYSQRDENNELHIADVFTPDGLALEFQHSPIDRREVEARTKFYKNICWIVDGLRLKTGLKRFQRALRIGFVRNFDGIDIHKIFAQDFSLLEQWARLQSLVIFDFGDNGLWVINHSNGHSAFAYQIERGCLIKQLKMGQLPSPIQTYDTNSLKIF